MSSRQIPLFSLHNEDGRWTGACVLNAAANDDCLRQTKTVGRSVGLTTTAATSPRPLSLPLPLPQCLSPPLSADSSHFPLKKGGEGSPRHCDVRSRSLSPPRPLAATSWRERSRAEKKCWRRNSIMERTPRKGRFIFCLRQPERW